MAVLLRLCDEDREKFGGPEWIRFDEDALDDQPLSVLSDWESRLNISLEFVLRVDKIAQTARWNAVRAWLGLVMAGEKVPDLEKFDIKARKIQVRDEPKGGDADPPASSSPSAAEKGSKKRSR